MSGAHTPGPWEYAHRKGANGMYRTEVFSGLYGVIATCEWTQKDCGNGVTKTYREDNARLIATAPDLLVELKNLYMAYVNLLENGRDKITALGGDCDPVDVMEMGDPFLRYARLTIAKATGAAS